MTDIRRLEDVDGNLHDINAPKTNDHVVNNDVPSDAEFTDTQFTQLATQSDAGLMSASDKAKLDALNIDELTLKNLDVIISRMQLSVAEQGFSLPKMFDANIHDGKVIDKVSGKETPLASDGGTKVIINNSDNTWKPKEFTILVAGTKDMKSIGFGCKGGLGFSSSYRQIVSTGLGYASKGGTYTIYDSAIDASGGGWRPEKVTHYNLDIDGEYKYAYAFSITRDNIEYYRWGLHAATSLPYRTNETDEVWQYDLSEGETGLIITIDGVNTSRVVVYDGLLTDETAKTSAMIATGNTTSDLISQKALALQTGETYSNIFGKATNGVGFTWSIADETIVKRNSDFVTALKEGTTNIVFKSIDKTVSVPVTVGKQVIDESGITKTTNDLSGIYFVNPPATMEVGQEWAIEAVGMNKTGLLMDAYQKDSINITSSDNSVASVSFGTVTAIAPGTVTITATSPGGTTATYTLKVVAEDRWWEDEDIKTYAAPYVEPTFEGFQKVLDYASANGYKKVKFPRGKTYTIDPSGSPVELPSNMVIDFNYSTILMKENNSHVTSRKAYTFLLGDEKEKIVLMNAKIYGENYYEWDSKPTKYHVEHTQLLDLQGCKHCRIINCDISYGVGFTVTIDHKKKANTRIPLKLANIEAGGINDDGTLNDNANTFRSKDFIGLKGQTYPLKLSGKEFMLGALQGFQRWYMFSRFLKVLFYDDDKNLISVMKYARQYGCNELPGNAAYAKLEFYQGSAPTQADPDFGGVVMFFSISRSYDNQFENCSFKGSCSCALLACGDMTILDKCTIDSCGYIDPASSIDWEDFGETFHSVVLRHCSFGCKTGWTAHFNGVRGNSIVMHDNIFNNAGIYFGSETENHRIYHNIIKGNVNLDGKQESVFAGNILSKDPSIGGEKKTYVADNDVILDDDFKFDVPGRGSRL